MMKNIDPMAIITQLEAKIDNLIEVLEYALETLEAFENEGYENDDFSAAGTRIIVREAIAKPEGYSKGEG